MNKKKGPSFREVVEQKKKSLKEQLDFSSEDEENETPTYPRHFDYLNEKYINTTK